jgi:hypothetical protein
VKGKDSKYYRPEEEDFGSSRPDNFASIVDRRKGNSANSVPQNFANILSQQEEVSGRFML